MRRLIFVTVSFCFILFIGCDRKNNPLLNYPGSGVSSVSLFIPQIDTQQASKDLNRIFVYVADNGGSPVTSFQLGNFSILEGGTPGIPFEVGNVTDPLYIVLAIDRSGSMAGSNTTAANAAAIDLINATASSDYMALIEFASEPSVTVDFTTSKATLISAVNAGVASGATSLYDATTKAADLLAGKNGRGLLIVLTDGEDTASSASLSGAVEAVNKKGLSAYMVGLGSGISSTTLDAIATQTGGISATSADGSGLSSIFLSILNRFNNLVYIKYRRHADGRIAVYLNYGSLTANASKALD
ncbi:MAG: hypothetical protein KCHDKBKB_00124 [Elusimicrobia bacterium]|nr:hypothetical protein [Elusimicrobiota bacterium]